MRSLFPRHSLIGRLVSVSLLVFCIFLFVAGVCLPIANQFYERHTDILQERQSLGKLESIVGTKTSTENQFNQLQAMIKSRGEFLSKSTTSLAGADLQSRLRAISAGEGTNITSVKVLTPDISNEKTVIKIRVSMSGNLRSMKDVLHEIETSVPYFIVDDFDLRPARVQRSESEVYLDAKFTISARYKNSLSK